MANRDSKTSIDRILAQASAEVATWPHWMRSPDVLAELARLGVKDNVESSTPRYETPEDEKVRSLGKLKCRGCERFFLYAKNDRVIVKNEDRRFVRCPCGLEYTLAIGGLVK